MERASIFVSRPNDLTASQQGVWRELAQFLRKRGLTPRVVGSTDYPDTVPLAFVAEVMQHCTGAIIMGFRQTHVREGTLKAGTSKEQPVRDVYLPTPWNHLEAGMAYQLGLPLLIICEPDMTGGIFGIGSSDRYIHHFDLSTAKWIGSDGFLQPFNAWYAETLKRSTER